MMSAEICKQNLEFLEANADVVRQLTQTMDRVLQTDAQAYGGKLAAGQWVSMGGEPDPAYEESSFATATGLVQEVRHIQEAHARYGCNMLPGIRYSHLSIARRAIPDSSDSRGFVRRFNMWGMETTTGEHEAAHYRFEWKDAGGEAITNSFILGRLGQSAVRAELWALPDIKEFAEQCIDAFADTKVVNDLLRGEFVDENDLDQQLSALVVGPEYTDLYEELRTKALAARQGAVLVTEHNLYMPSRDQLTHVHNVLQNAF